MIAKIINDALANGKLKSRISPIMPLAEAAAAHRLLEDSQRSLVKAERKDCFYIIDPIGMRRIPLRSSPDDDHRFPGPRL